MKSIKSTNQEHTNVINVALAWNFSMKLSLSKQSYIHLWPNSINPLQCYVTVCQCWNWPKRTGGVSCRNVWNFAQGLKFKADFHSKMGVCRHELRGGGSTRQSPDNSNPAVCCQSPGVEWEVCHRWCQCNHHHRHSVGRYSGHDHDRSLDKLDQCRRHQLPTSVWTQFYWSFACHTTMSTENESHYKSHVMNRWNANCHNITLLYSLSQMTYKLQQYKFLYIYYEIVLRRYKKNKKS